MPIPEVWWIGVASPCQASAKQVGDDHGIGRAGRSTLEVIRRQRTDEERWESCFWPRVENLCGKWKESYLNNEELEEACVEFADDGGFCGAENRSGIWNWSIIIHSCVDFCTYLKFCLFFCWHWHFQGCKDGKFIVLGPQTSLNSRLASRSKFMENNNCRLKYVSWAIEKNFQRFQHLEVGTGRGNLRQHGGHLGLQIFCQLHQHSLCHLIRWY